MKENITINLDNFAYPFAIEFVDTVIKIDRDKTLWEKQQ